MNTETLIETYKGYDIHIVRDEYPVNPRKEWRHTTKITATHESGIADKGLASDQPVVPKGALAWPIYLMEHSGAYLSMSPERFSVWDREGWDWGPVGIIYVDEEDAISVFGDLPKDQLLKEVESLVRNEFDEFRAYVEGDVLGWRVVDPATNNVIESCWGYYGYDANHDRMIFEAKDCIDYTPTPTP